MKRILVIAVLAVLLTSTAGAATAMAAGPTKTALTISAPGSADVGSSFDVTGKLSDEATTTPVKGQLITVYQSTDSKKWTEAGTATTKEDGAYTVPMKQTTVTYSYKAEFAGDKDFKKATSGTVTVGVSAPGGGYYSPLYGFWLQNLNGWFVAKLACYYSTDNGATWTESAHTKGIAMGAVVAAKLGDLNVPEGALVKIHVIVVGGKDRTGSEVFQYYYTYARESHHAAEYYISGTTFNPKLEYIGDYCCMA